MFVAAQTDVFSVSVWKCLTTDLSGGKLLSDEGL